MKLPDETATEFTEFLVVAGLSGAGRSTAADALEDVGWFVIDNLPPTLVGDVADWVARPASSVRRLALVSTSSEYRDEVPAAVKQLRARSPHVRVLFLESPADVLVRRYEATRRRHPLHVGGASASSLVEAIDVERHLLEGVRAIADVVIDTGEMNVHGLSRRIRAEFGDGATMTTAVMSFGYKHGLPSNADFVFDCRFLENPYWVPELRPLSGRDEEVSSWVLSQPAGARFVVAVMGVLVDLLPAFASEGRSYLTIAFGCSGGRHRSVAVAEEVARVLRDGGHELSCTHRDIDR